MYQSSEANGSTIVVTKRCIVFLLSGSFDVAGKTWDEAGWGYDLKNEVQIVLRKQSAVVIIQL